MQRICFSLANQGYKVTLIGRKLTDSPALQSTIYSQKRLFCKKTTGKLFYLEFNYRLYRFLERIISQEKKRIPGIQIAVCAIDLDTILPVYLLSKKFNLPRVYDAHELFTEMAEVKRRPAIYRLWKSLERFMVPRFPFGYTVNQFLADEFNRRYAVQYKVVRNLPKRVQQSKAKIAEGRNKEWSFLPERFFLYQGAVNEGRAFEWLIPAMKNVKIPLVIAGKGNFYQQTWALVQEWGLEEKVIFLGPVLPEKLISLTPLAYAGITFFIRSGMNQYNSLANRFFDYIQAEIPQLCVNYPEYSAVNQQYKVSILIDNLDPDIIAFAMNKLLDDVALHQQLADNCKLAAQELCWEKEAEILISFWNKIIPVYAITN